MCDMHDYIFNVSLFLAMALALITAIGYHTDGRADRRRRERYGGAPRLYAPTGRYMVVMDSSTSPSANASHPSTNT
jgi:hypothetical protein